MSLEYSINSVGNEVFSRLKKYSSSPLTFNYWNKKLLNFTSHYPEFKHRLFEFISALPTLHSNEEIITKLNQTLGEESVTPHPIIDWLASPAPLSLRGSITARIMQLGTRQMAKSFIAAPTPESAIGTLHSLRNQQLAFTADLLGEYAVDQNSSEHYFKNYLHAMDVLSDSFSNCTSQTTFTDHLGERKKVCFSIKLTALHHQMPENRHQQSIDILTERLTEIALVAKQRDLSLYVDIEDSAHNPLIVATFERVFRQQALIDYAYPGIVVQAYARNGESILRNWIRYSQKRGCPIAVRLVKGAYWDTETSLAQLQGKPSPVFSFKQSSDANYEHLTRILLENREFCYPAFASHNIRSLVHAICYANSLNIDVSEFELQMLYGMADPIAKTFRDLGYLSRLYVPIGELVPGVGYLVRRLLENSSNESFLKHAFIDEVDSSELLRKPEYHQSEHAIG